MQQYIFKLELWLTKWRIAINTDKTHTIVFRKKRTHNSPPTLQIFNQTIDWTFETKYLGLILNDKLTYSSHFKEITKKYWKKLYSLNDIIGRKSKLSLKNRLFVYKQYVRPLLLYGCAIWGSAGYVHIDSLQRLQNKALRTIARAPRFLPRYILHEELRVEPIHTIIAELSSNFHSMIPYHTNATINSQNHFRNLPPSTHLFPATVDRLGDSKDQVRLMAKSLLLKLMNPVSSPQPIIHPTFIKLVIYRRQHQQEYTTPFSTTFRSAPYPSTVGPFSCRPAREQSRRQPDKGGYQRSCGSRRPLHGPYVD
ncbi:RNA-directed DNA polymerase from mobile element jockey [Trichonephila clavipes]|uniref:RNA-directed DNA polymerase from mobile element jockey n=1 Tax=Trichonephila clavipes TaxID=2585209 RepID=A0A8X6SY64_TRICX|nr:RNA-directed DNA polymerase from mobile element jockey [Trichonephila clavipes]